MEFQECGYSEQVGGRLRKRKVDSTGTTRYLLDGLSVIAEYAPAGSRQALYVQSLARIDEVLSVTNGSGKYWYETDALGSVYTLTTATGAVQARGGYDVFGESVALSGTAVGQPFGFTGREHEADSGLVYARARYLSSVQSRWNQPDPLGDIDGPNLYGYASNNPTRYVDSLGLTTGLVPCFLKGFLAGVISSFALVGIGLVAGALLPAWFIPIVMSVVMIAAVIVMSVQAAVAIVYRNWDLIAYMAGAAVGAILVGGFFGRWFNELLNGTPSPPNWSVKWETTQLYSPDLGTIVEWLSTGPTVGLAAAFLGIGGTGGAGSANLYCTRGC